MDQNRIALDDGELTPKFLNDEERALFAQADLGEQAITFLNSELGRFMRGCAMQDRSEALEALAHPDADPDKEDGRDKIRDARFKAAVANQFLEYIQAAVNNGEVAFQSLMQLRDESQ
jgi:hypothetical protein